MTILEAIRFGTANDHKQIENDLSLFDRVKSLSSYRDLLIDFHNFYLPLEGKISARSEWISLGFDLNSRLKTQKLKQDISLIDSDGEQSISFQEDLPRSRKASEAELPKLSSFGEILGCVYVLEGATLGSQVIYKHLRENIGIDPRFMSFHYGYGPETGKMWQSFRAFLLRHSESRPELNDSIIRGAKATFRALGSWIVTRHELRAARARTALPNDGSLSI